MISELRQENFKCFSDLRLPLAPLTLFTGLNAAGKSSSLQTLLLLVQSSRGRQDASSLKLNGSIATLGTPTDVINMNVGGTRLALGFTSGESSFFWRFVVNSEQESKSLVLSELELHSRGQQKHIKNTELRGLWPNDPDFHADRELLDSLVFLGAARQVESEVFPIPDEGLHALGDVGRIGEFAPWWLNREADAKVPEAKWHPSTDKNGTLRNQVDL